MNLKGLLLAGAVAVGLAFLNSATAAPGGSFAYDFDASDSPVWDVSGEYHLSPTVGGETSVDFMIAVTQDGRGNIEGSGSTEVRIDGELVQGNYTVKGKVFRAGPVTKVTALVRLSGSGMFRGEQRSYALVSSYALKIDPATGVLSGVGRGGARASGIGEGPLRETVNTLLPSTLDGGWDLTLDIATVGKNITGTALATLNNARQIAFNVKGVYSEKTGKSSISLTGTSPNQTNKLKLTAMGDALELTKVRGLLLGQVVND